MKRLIMIAALALISTSVFAEITKPPAAALGWWLKGKNKLDGSTVCTKQNGDGSYSVTEWKVLGMPKPTDAEIMQVCYDYENAQPAIEVEKKANERKKALEVIGITEEDIIKIKALK